MVAGEKVFNDDDVKNEFMQSVISDVRLFITFMYWPLYGTSTSTVGIVITTRARVPFFADLIGPPKFAPFYAPILFARRPLKFLLGRSQPTRTYLYVATGS